MSRKLTSPVFAILTSLVLVFSTAGFTFAAPGPAAPPAAR